MGERLKPAVLKTVSPERGSGVRIPLPPPVNLIGCLEGMDRSVSGHSTRFSPVSGPWVLTLKTDLQVLGCSDLVKVRHSPYASALESLAL